MGRLSLASGPLFYYAFAWNSARRFFGVLMRWAGLRGSGAGRRSERPSRGIGAEPPRGRRCPAGERPQAGRGVDRHTFEHFASFCRQDYPEFEVPVRRHRGTRSSRSCHPAVDARRSPERSIRLIVGVADIGASSKVSKLCRLAREARHDLLVLSDSDIAVPRDYLSAVVAPFRDPDVGAVTCLYRGVPEAGIPAALEAIGISTDFVPGVIVARRVEGVKFMLGATMATTRAGSSKSAGLRRWQIIARMISNWAPDRRLWPPD